jgi:hypothetical protein
MEPKIYILHENDEWVVPLRKALDKLGAPYEMWHLAQGMVNLQQAPPPGIFYNRMSASSHTRGHRYAVELTESVLAWLEAHRREVVNNRHALTLEVRKTEQYQALLGAGINVPYTVACVGPEALLAAADQFEGRPFLLKPNRGGKGLGIELFNDKQQLEKRLGILQESIGGVVLLQEYIPPANGAIIRLEFIGGRFYYAVKVDASDGFELCPADSCQVDSAFCPADGKAEKFEVLDGFYIPELPVLEQLLLRNGIAVGAVEFVENEQGERFFYDVNINTNYNEAAESRNASGKSGMGTIAAYLTARFNASFHPNYAHTAI